MKCANCGRDITEANAGAIGSYYFHNDSDLIACEGGSIIKAAAWLDGCDTAYTEHLRPLQHVLWDDETQIAKVAKVVSEIAAPACAC